jgi:predicted nuclease of predicted toxin-antitoxin system
MNLLADHCVWGKTIRLLRQSGQAVTTLKELGKEAASDDEVLAIARELDAVLITNDLDFGNVQLYPPSSHEGIIVLRLDYRTAFRVHQVLVDFLGRTNREEIRGALVIINPGGYRIRRKGVKW